MYEGVERSELNTAYYISRTWSLFIQTGFNISQHFQNHDLFQNQLNKNVQ